MKESTFLKRNKTRIRNLLAVFLILLVLFETAAYFSTITRPSEKFFQLYVLGSDGTAGNYYPNNSSSLQIGENIGWHIGVVNDMGTAQFVSIRVKLSNQTMNSPNDTLAISASAPIIAEFNHFLGNNETWQIPFEWQIANYTLSTNEHVIIQELTIDNATYALVNAPTCISLNSCNFRLIFELWTWNVTIAGFQFGWWNNGQEQAAWLQLWFSISPQVTPPPPPEQK